MHHLVLLVAGVLKFVHHYVFVVLSVGCKNFREFFKKPDGQHYKVVKIHRIVEFKTFLVGFVEFPVHFVFGIPLLAAGFYVRYEYSYFIDVQSFRRIAQFPTCFFYKGVAVCFVVD